VSCATGTSCSITCTGSCSVSCATGATCELQCNGQAAPHSIPGGGGCP
jgi:hypothetical protein